MIKPLKWSKTSKEEKDFCKLIFRAKVKDMKDCGVSLTMRDFRVFWKWARYDAYATFNQE